MDDEIIIITCPHCEDYILIYKKEINCAIFRHAINKNTFMQINPHASKEECDYLITNNLVYGCAKPLKLIYDNNEYIGIKCEYI